MIKIIYIILKLYFRPFKLELAESKVETAVPVAVSPNLFQSHNHSHTNSCNSSTPSSPISVQSDNNFQRHNAYTPPKLKENRPLSPTTKLPPKMEKLQENENEMLYYEFEVNNKTFYFVKNKLKYCFRFLIKKQKLQSNLVLQMQNLMKT